MQFNITSNMDEFMRLLRQTPDAMADGVNTAMHDIKKDWHDEAHDIAPLDKGDLRAKIRAKVDGAGIEKGVEIQSNTNNRGFNYAYFIHEENAGGKSLRTPGTVKEYLDKSADKRADTWVEWLEDDMKRELRRKGW